MIWLFLACGTAPEPPSDEVIFLGVPAKDARPAYEVSIVLPKGTTARIPAEKWMMPLLQAIQGPIDACWALETLKVPDWELLATWRLDGAGGSRLVTVDPGDAMSRCVLDRFDGLAAMGFPAEKLDVPFGVRLHGPENTAPAAAPTGAATGG